MAPRLFFHLSVFKNITIVRARYDIKKLNKINAKSGILCESCSHRKGGGGR